MSYDTLRDVAAKTLHMSAGVDVLVADESHHLFNEGALRTAFANVPSGACLLLTGTPLANNLTDLYALATLARRGCLGTRADFHEDYVVPIAAGVCSPSPPLSRALPSAPPRARRSRLLVA